MSLDGFSLNPLINELNDKLAGGRIDKSANQTSKIFIYIFANLDRHIFYIFL